MVVCESARGRRREAGGRRSGRERTTKTRTPHKDVGNKNPKRCCDSPDKSGNHVGTVDSYLPDRRLSPFRTGTGSNNVRGSWQTTK